MSRTIFLVVCLQLALISKSLSSQIDERLISKALAEAQREMEVKALSAKTGFDFNSIPGHARFINSDRVTAMEKRNILLKMATEKVAKETGLKLDRANEMVKSHPEFRATDICNETVPPCSAAEMSSIFTPIDGRCNNIENPILGTTNRPLRRLLPVCDRNIITTRDTLLNVNSSEESGESERTSSDQCDTGNLLPNVRLVSRTFHNDSDVPSTQDQLFTMFGQFVCHDLLLTPTQRVVSNCCSTAGLADFQNCLPIIIPAGDSFFNTSQCLDFKRSTLFCNEQGQERRHINQLSAYVDAGNIYGADSSTAGQLRTMTGGLLKQTNPGRLLPKLSLTGTLKFTAGEGRVTENPALTTLHTIFMREHNRVATLVGLQNPSLTDTEIYYQTRRIVTAEYQNIVFSEFLPILIGSKSVFPPGYQQTTYDPTVDPSITNEFAASALRFGHSTVNGFFSQNDPISGNSVGGYLLRTSNNNESIYGFEPDMGMTSIAKGMTMQAAQTFDNFMTKELTNFLYASISTQFAFGSDLAARNIQRGRDNGLSSWVQYRKLCKGKAPSDWDNRPADISVQNWNKLRSLYTSVGDIDLFSGSLAERTVPRGALGVTATCIMEQQFERLLSGDRYFFAHKDGVGSNFSKPQIKALRNVSMFDLVCLNTNIADLQKKAFEIANQDNNPLASCSTAESVDVSLFV